MDSNTIITYLEQLLVETTPEVSTLVRMKDGVTNLIDLYRILEVVEKND